jgi:hypothetical protein
MIFKDILYPSLFNLTSVLFPSNFMQVVSCKYIDRKILILAENCRDLV